MESRSALRAWGEGIGIAGLVLSLVFVGYEVRQNTPVARAEAYRSFVGEVNDWYGRIADPQFADVFQRAIDDYAALTPAERMQLGGHTRMILRIYEGLHKEVNEGVLDQDALQLLSRADWSYPWFTEEWPVLREALTPDFVAYMESEHGLGS